MVQSFPSRFHSRSIAAALALGGLVLVIAEFRRRAMTRNDAQFRATYDSTASR
jgi:hypothetical protein